jgi:hypothetical protein
MSWMEQVMPWAAFVGHNPFHGQVEPPGFADHISPQAWQAAADAG